MTQSKPPTSSGKAQKAPALSQADYRELIAFLPSRRERYVSGFVQGLREQAQQAGFAITIFENDFDQHQQDQQVQKQIESGAHPSMWLWWPATQDARASLEALNRTRVPILQINQLPDAQSQPLVTAFVGPDDVLRTKNAALLLAEAHGESGDAAGTGRVLAVTYNKSYGGYALCMSALKDALANHNMEIVGEINVGFGAEVAYAATQAWLNDHPAPDFDLLYGMDDALLQGAIQALEEAGFTAGKDFKAVGTVGNGDRSLLDTGKQYGTTLQAPLLEGQLAIKVAEEYLADGELSQFHSFTPNPIVRAGELSAFSLKGYDGVSYRIEELATWQVKGRSTGTDVPLLRMHNISRSFGAIQALKEVSFELEAGEVMALVGENGAGKSTLVKIISGFDGGYTGLVELEGQEIELRTPARAESHGIAIAQQELSLIPTMTVAENVFLANPNVSTWASIAQLAKDARPHLELVGLGYLDPTVRTDRLSVGEQHLVEIARLIARNAQILILDEPTAALGEAESRRIMAQVTSLAEAGKSIIYVSHRLDEVFAIADRVTVLRDGRSQEAVPVSSLTVDSLIERMLGRSLANMFPPRNPDRPEGEVVLEIDGLWADGLVEPISLKVRAGEILGLAGQLGSGTGYLLAAMAGARRNRGGTLHMAGKAFLPKTPDEAIFQGIAYCSSDRKLDGLFLGLPVFQNMSAPKLGRISRFGWLSRRGEMKLARDLAQDFAVDVNRVGSPAETLSGGNQQKVAVGKWMSISPKVLLVNEPTRGVDVGARAEIYDRLREMADAGVAVVFASTDIQEVTYLPDRIVTFYRGQLIETLDAEKVDSNRLLRDITNPYDDIQEGAREASA